MSAEQAPRLSLGRRVAIGGGFLLLAAGGATVTTLAGMESIHDMGIAASADFKGDAETARAAYHERTLDNYGALIGFIDSAMGIGVAAVRMRGVYSDFMRVSGQVYAGANPAEAAAAAVAYAQIA